MEVMSHMSTQKNGTVAGKTVFNGFCATVFTDPISHLHSPENVMQFKVIAGQALDSETELKYNIIRYLRRQVSP